MSISPVFLPAWNNLQGLEFWLPLKAKIFWLHLLVLPQSASAAALLSSALGCLLPQISPKYRYLKWRGTAYWPVPGDHKQGLLEIKIFSILCVEREWKRDIYYKEWYFTYFAEFSKKQWSTRNINRIILEGISKFISVQHRIHKYSFALVSLFWFSLSWVCLFWNKVFS